VQNISQTIPHASSRFYRRREFHFIFLAVLSRPDASCWLRKAGCSLPSSSCLSISVDYHRINFMPCFHPPIRHVCTHIGVCERALQITWIPEFSYIFLAVAVTMAKQVNHHWVSLLNEVKKFPTPTLPRQMHCCHFPNNNSNSSSSCALLHFSTAGADVWRLTCRSPLRVKLNRTGQMNSKIAHIPT
jgi:hypothetical protein